MHEWPQTGNGVTTFASIHPFDRYPFYLWFEKVRETLLKPKYLLQSKRSLAIRGTR